MPIAVVGREHELGAVESFLKRTRNGPAALVIAGEPGIGKTTLWQTGVDEARPDFARVLLCRAVEAEATLSFAALFDLLADHLDDALAALTGPRRRALEVALLVREPGSEAPDPRAIGLALLDAVRVLAEEGPVLVAVDDLQWLDPSSAGVLQFAFRRLRGERVGLLATVRDAPGLHVPLELDVLERLSLGPLSLGALHHLLRERLGLELTRPELARLGDTTGGNPFFALELGRELVRLKARVPPGRPLPVPDNLKELLGGRLSRLPARTRHVLLSASALARPTVEVLAAVHGEEAVVELECAARVGVIEFQNLHVRFSHPLLAAVCYQDAAPWRRRAAHRLLAGAVSELEERARHLALAAESSNAEVASTLDTAAEQAGSRGATAAAAELAELAAELTPPDDPRGRRRRLLRAADFHCFSGDRERARAIPEQLLAEVPPGPERGDVLFKLASARMGDVPATIRLCEEALREAADDNARSAEILAFLSYMRVLIGDVRGALTDARLLLRRAKRARDPVLLAQALARVGQAETWTLEITPGLLERGVRIEEGLDRSLELHDSPSLHLARRLVSFDDPDRARELMERVEARAVAHGDESTRAHVRCHLSYLECYTGRWEQALQHAVPAVELADQLHDTQYRGVALGAQALACAYLGRIDDARAAAEEAAAIAAAVSDTIDRIFHIGVLGFLELSLGNLSAALRQLGPLPAQLVSNGWDNPATLSPIWPDSIEVLAGLGELAQARSYLEQFEERAQRLQSPWATATAARCRGLLSAAEGDLPAAFEAFDRALAEHDRSLCPFERGRTWFALGSVRRRARQKRAAREALEQALATFEELGARLWAEKAREELARVSGRRPASKELTQMEERVAALAGQGLSNKEIASALFVSVHTVEAHLSRVYRKLAIRSRAALARRLAASEDGTAEEATAKV